MTFKEAWKSIKERGSVCDTHYNRLLYYLNKLQLLIFKSLHKYKIKMVNLFIKIVY